MYAIGGISMENVDLCYRPPYVTDYFQTPEQSMLNKTRFIFTFIAMEGPQFLQLDFDYAGEPVSKDIVVGNSKVSDKKVIQDSVFIYNM